MSLQADGWQEPDFPAQSASPGGPEIASLVSRPLWLDQATGRRSFQDSRFGLRKSGLDDNLARLMPGITPHPEDLLALIHDARNMVTAMEMYCDLLEEPGVLTASFRHYAAELRLVGAASRRLLEELAGLGSRMGSAVDSELRHTADSIEILRESSRGNPRASARESVPESPKHSSGFPPSPRPSQAPDAIPPRTGRQRFQPGRPIASLAQELRTNQNLISALVGPGITVGLSIAGGQRPVAMNGDDLTRVLVNLARNAAEVMAGAGHIQIGLTENAGALCLSVSDNGPGIPESSLESVFSSGFTTHIRLDSSSSSSDAWPVQHSGLGLSIVRTIVTAAGGSVWAENRTGGNDSGGGSYQNESYRAESQDSDSSAMAASGGAVIRIEFPIHGSSSSA